jgi:L-amino acid N-acyltransferase YncA
MQQPSSGKAGAAVVVRPAGHDDAAAIARIYNQGIDDRLATFETEHRSAETVIAWLDSGYPVVVSEAAGEVAAFAAAFPYRSRPCYAGVREFSVYVRRDLRGGGHGRLVLSALVEAVRDQDGWKLLSRIFPENAASLALCRSLDFREVGVYRRHGRLDGRWRDTVIVEKLIDTETDQF